MSPCLQIDLGNSSAKWRLVESGRVIARGQFNPAASRPLQDIAPAPVSVWVSSVAGAGVEASLADAVSASWGIAPWFARAAAQTAGLKNSYAEPERMGVDRWLAMLGARARYGQRLCVVDSGSATTIDVVAANGQHEGGYILPGAHLMEQALLRDTERVRFDEAVPYLLTPGQSTAEAVRNGIAVAQAGAVAVALDSLQGEAPHLFYCGGGGEMLHTLVGRGGELVPDLVFEGLEVAAAEAGL